MNIGDRVITPDGPVQYHGHGEAVKELLVARGRLRDERNGFLERANQARGDS